MLEPDFGEPDFARLAAARVAVAGMGLMGGSLALALRGHCAELVGLDRDPQAVQIACERGVVDRGASQAEATDCDLLVLAAPVRAILGLLRELSEMPEPAGPVVVLDLGSTKRAIAAAMQALPPRFDPVGGHPMCGKEVSGLAYADAGLFRDRVFVLTPLERTSREALGLARAVAEAAGARPVRLTPERHDDLAAIASHLPYAVAALLVRAAQRADDEQVWTMAASGFRDTSRLAASDVDMMLDILLTNREPLLRALDGYQREVAGLIRLLEAGDADELRALLEAVRAGRRAHFP